MQFRKTEWSDIDRIMQILAEGRASLAALGIDQWQGGYPHRDAIELDVRNGDSYVLVDANGLVFATAMIGFTGESDYDRIVNGSWLTDCSSSDPHYGVVHRVAVASDFQGRGIASYLIEQAEDMVATCDFASVRIDTHPGNKPMRRLLEKRGYTECGTIYISHAEGSTPDRIAYEKLVDHASCRNSVA